MTEHFLHLIATDEGDYGWSLESPQVPDLVYGRPSLAELKKGMNDVLQYADAPDLQQRAHQQRRFESPDGVEFRIRVADDEHFTERAEIAERVARSLAQGTFTDDALEERRRTRFGDALFIVVRDEDRLGWLFEQTDDRDGVVNMVGSVNDVLVWVNQFSTGHHVDGMVSLEEFGLTLDSTVADIREATVRLNDRVLVPA